MLTKYPFPPFSRPFLLLIRRANLSTWVFQFRIWSTHVPKNFVDSSIGISIELSTIFSLLPPLFGLKSTPTVLLTFRVSLFVLNQSWREAKSSSTQYFRYLRCLLPMYMVVSSVNWMHCICCKFRCKSLQKMRNIRGPRQLPCGVPYLTSNVLDHISLALDEVLYLSSIDLSDR